MASRFYALERGEGVEDITDGLSTQTKTFEFVINLADGATQDEVSDALEKIKLKIEQGPWPPAAA
jgi:hypothetical protein